MAAAFFLMVVAMSLIPLGDTAGKLLGQQGVPAVTVAWARFTLGGLCLIPFVVRSGIGGALLDWRVLFRGALIVATVLAILTALRTEDIASVFAAFFVGPLLSYVLSVLLLAEPVSPLRSLLVAAGFAGVLLVVRPGFGMTPGMGWAVLSGLFYGCFLTVSRWLAGRHPPLGLLLAQMVVGAVVLAPVAAVAGGLGAGAPLLFGISGVASMLANLLLVLAYRRAGATRLAPFVYFQLIAATALGWGVFGDLPDPLALAGLGVILASGLGSLALRQKA